MSIQAAVFSNDTTPLPTLKAIWFAHLTMKKAAALWKAARQDGSSRGAALTPQLNQFTYFNHCTQSFFSCAKPPRHVFSSLENLWLSTYCRTTALMITDGHGRWSPTTAGMPPISLLLRLHSVPCANERCIPTLNRASSTALWRQWDSAFRLQGLHFKFIGSFCFAGHWTIQTGTVGESASCISTCTQKVKTSRGRKCATGSDTS